MAYVLQDLHYGTEIAFNVEDFGGRRNHGGDDSVDFVGIGGMIYIVAQRIGRALKQTRGVLVGGLGWVSNSQAASQFICTSQRQIPACGGQASLRSG